MEDHGYNLRQRPFPIIVSTQSAFPIFSTVSTTGSLATIAPSSGSTSAPTLQKDYAAHITGLFGMQLI